MNFTEYVNAATFPIQISYMGISLGKGNAASFTHLVNAIQQPVYPFSTMRYIFCFYLHAGA